MLRSGDGETVPGGNFNKKTSEEVNGESDERTGGETVELNDRGD